MAVPFRTTGSLCPTCVADWLVSLSVKHVLSLHFCKLFIVFWFLTKLYIPLKASDTLLEATVPVKLTVWYCQNSTSTLRKQSCFQSFKIAIRSSQGISLLLLCSLVFYTCEYNFQYQTTVKLHRVCWDRLNSHEFFPLLELYVRLSSHTAQTFLLSDKIFVPFLFCIAKPFLFIPRH